MAHVFQPHTKTTFNGNEREGVVSISSDAKAVVVDLAVGDGCAAGAVAFTFSSDGKCVLGPPPEPAC